MSVLPKKDVKSCTYHYNATKGLEHLGNLESTIPKRFSIRRRRLPWQAAARLLFCCHRRILTNSFLSRRISSSSPMPGSTCSSTAKRTWQIVQSGFFSPQTLRLFGEKQHAHHAEDQMALQGDVPPHLEVVHTDLPFTLFEQPLDRRPAKCDMQQGFNGRIRRGIGQEILCLILQHIVGDDEPAFLAGQLVFPGKNCIAFARQTTAPLPVSLMWKACSGRPSRLPISSTDRDAGAPGARTVLTRWCITGGRCSQPVVVVGISTT